MAWYVMQAPMAGALSYLHEFLMVEYERIFGSEVMHRIDCTIYNDPSCSGPYCHYTYPALIRLHQESLDYWAQTVYQLSHEMTHYACFSVRGRPEGGLVWYEEILCEAMSLYALEYAASNWNKCWLYRINAGFDRMMREYLDDALNEWATGGLASCRTPRALLSYEMARTAEIERSGYCRERTRLYRAIRQEPVAAGALPYYVNFIRPGSAVVDFAAWQRANPYNPLLPVFADIQPVK